MKWKVLCYILEVFIKFRSKDFRKEDGIILKKILIALIKFYRKYISPMKTTKCPYYPTCSTYGLEAVEKYGAVKGGALALWRIIRCNPFSKGGIDPVP